VSAATAVAAPRAQLYRLISTQSGWVDWFADKGYGNLAIDSVFEVHHYRAGNLGFVYQAFMPEQSVRFTLLPLKTLTPSEVVVRLEDQGNEVAVQIEHTGLAAEEADYWQRIWQDGLDTLKAIMETGKNPRIWNRPFLGVMVDEWVTPEVAAEKGLATSSGMRISSVFENKGAANAGLTGGDTIVSLAGIEITDFDSLMDVYAEYKAGATIPLKFYRGDELHTADLTLSAYPVPEVPATAQDIADNLADFFKNANQKISQISDQQTEAQIGFRPAAGEWSAKEVIAHMIASENDSLVWLSSYINGREVYAYTSATPARIKMLLSVYPTMDALLKKLAETQAELVALISEVPADMVSRKTSLVRLAFTYSMDISLHYREHLAQLKDLLEKASDVRGS
jgi:hypothetical protein